MLLIILVNSVYMSKPAKLNVQISLYCTEEEIPITIKEEIPLTRYILYI